MNNPQKWAKLVAAALARGVRWVYEGLQGTSDGLSWESRGTATRRRPERLRSPFSNPDTQHPWTEPK